MNKIKMHRLQSTVLAIVLSACSAGDDSDPTFAISIEKTESKTVKTSVELVQLSTSEQSTIADNDQMAALASDDEASKGLKSPTPKLIVSKITGQENIRLAERPSKVDLSLVAKEPHSPVTQSAKTILVLDASGSMWGQIDGKAKIEIANEVVSKTVAKWGDNSDLGLMAYGHNRKGDCTDIELLIEPGKVESNSFIATASSIKPNGKTPLTEAVKRAAEHLKYEEDKATVILISDGKETCGLDPCLVGAALEESGVDFTAHVIGFDVPDEDTRGMKCLADQTGGVFIKAKNARELHDALEDTRSMATDQTKQDLTPAVISLPSSVPAGSLFDTQWSGPKNIGDVLVVSDPQAKRKQLGRKSLRLIDFVSPTKMKAPEEPGLYQVNYLTKDHDVLGSAKLNVVPVSASISVSKKEIFAGNRIEVIWSGPANDKDEIVVTNNEGQRHKVKKYTPRLYKAFADEKHPSPAEIDVPDIPGNYRVVYRTAKDKKPLAHTEIVVLPASASITVPSSVTAGKSFNLEWTGPENRNDRLKIFSLDGAESYHGAAAGKLAADRARKGRPARLIAPKQAGTYIVKLLTAEKRELANVTLLVE